MHYGEEARPGGDTGLVPLLRAIKLGDCTIANRLMMSALTLQYGENGAVSERHAAFYRERALGGVGLILSEQLNATSVCASPFSNALHADSAECAGSLRKVVDAIADTETKFFAQLFASGACGAPTSLENFAPLRAPSSVGFPGGQRPLALTRSEIAEIVRDFAVSAANVKAAGCHGVEIHGAHGWLIGEFLSPYYNRRDDEFGGSLENRCRFAIDIGKAVRDAVGPGFPLGISLTYDEMIGDAGITPGDTLAQVEILSNAGLFDFFDFSIGSVHAEHFTIAPMDVPEGFALDFARDARKLLNGRAAVMVSGRVVDVDQAARAVASGSADLVAMSRAHIADPHILSKAIAGQRNLIKRCIGDNACLQNALAGERVKCLINPRTGRESEFPENITLASKTRRIVVVGAGPAGLMFAGRAALAGHDVTLHDKLAYPGGHVKIRSLLPARQPWQNVTDDLVTTLVQAKGKLALESMITQRQADEFDADLVVWATGAEWDSSDATLSTYGVMHGATEGVDVVNFDDAVLDTERLGTHLVIVDESGSLEPLGLAEKVRLSGREVTLVTSRPTAGDLTRPTMEYPHLMPRLRTAGVRFLCEAELRGVDGRAIRVKDIWGTRLPDIHDVRSLVFTTDRIPRTAEIPTTVALRGNLMIIGDAFAPRDTAVILHDAFFAAANL